MCKGRQAARVPDRSAEKERGLKNEYSVSLRCHCMGVPYQVLKAIHPRLQSRDFSLKTININVDLPLGKKNKYWALSHKKDNFPTDLEAV